MIIEYLKKIHVQGTTIVFATHDRDIFSFVPNARIVDIDELHHVSSPKKL